MHTSLEPCTREGAQRGRERESERPAISGTAPLWRKRKGQRIKPSRWRCEQAHPGGGRGKEGYLSTCAGPPKEGQGWQESQSKVAPISRVQGLMGHQGSERPSLSARQKDAIKAARPGQGWKEQMKTWRLFLRSGAASGAPGPHLRLQMGPG